MLTVVVHNVAPMLRICKIDYDYDFSKYDEFIHSTFRGSTSAIMTYGTETKPKDETTNTNVKLITGTNLNCVTSYPS